MGKDKALAHKQKDEEKQRQKKYEEEQIELQRRFDKEREERQKYGWWEMDGCGRQKFISFEEAKINSYHIPSHCQLSYRDWEKEEIEKKQEEQKLREEARERRDECRRRLEEEILQKKLDEEEQIQKTKDMEIQKREDIIRFKFWFWFGVWMVYRFTF